MAQLKDTVVAGSLRATDTVYSTTSQFQILNIPTSSNGTTYGPGTSGQILKTNGTSVYWSNETDTDTKVTQNAAITTAGAYPVILAASTATAATTSTVNKTSSLTYNPSTKALVTGGTVDGYTLAAASAKGVTDNTSNADVTSADTNLITGRTLYYQLAKKGYTTNTGTVTSITPGNGLITGTSGTAQTAITGAGTISIGEGKVTNAMLAGSIANGKLANSSITIGSKAISLGGSATLAEIGVSYPVTKVAGKTGDISATDLRTALGLSQALRFLGKTTTTMSDGYTGTPAISGLTYTPTVGDVVIDSSNDSEYVCISVSGTTYTWERLGSDSSWALDTAVVHNTLTSAKGDMIYASVANTPERLAIGTTDQVLKVSSSGVPAWTTEYGSKFYYVEGPTTDTTAGTWTGSIEGLTAYYEGLTIIYVPHVAGANTTKLNINGLGAKTCYYTGTTALTTHYSVGTPILFTFYNDSWRRADYNTNTTYSIFNSLGHGNGSFVANSVIYRYQLLAHVDENKLTPFNNVSNGYNSTSKAILTTVEFDPFDEFFYYITTTTRDANAAVDAANLAWCYGGVDLRYSFNISTSVNALTAHKDVYMKVTPGETHDKVTLAAAFPLVQELPTYNDGYWYIFLGRAFGTYQMSLYPHHPVYYHDGTSIKELHKYDIDGYVKTAGDVMTGELSAPSMTAYGSSYPSFVFRASADGADLASMNWGVDQKRWFINEWINAASGTCEQYLLPAVTQTTGWHSYDILTSKKTVTIAQGGTGATTAPNARAALGLGSAATASTSSTVANNTSLPTGAAIISYISGLRVPEFITGTNASASNALTGVTTLTTIGNGQTFIYYTGAAVTATATQTITLTNSGGTTVASGNLYAYGTTTSKATFPAHTMIMFTYYNNAFYLVNPPTVY